MKRLALLLLCFLLTGCSYFGATEDILISSPASLSIIRMETFDVPQSPIQHSTTQDAHKVPSLSDSSDNIDAPSSDSSPSATSSTPSVTSQAIDHLILNTSGKTIHYYENCSYVARMKEENRGSASAVMQDALIEQGYKVCSWCAKN